MTDNQTTKKKSPAEAKGDCTICKGWVNDGRGGMCVFANDYWSPNCPLTSTNDNQTTEQTATERLRALLDEQELEWRRWTKSGRCGFTNVETSWFVPCSRIGCNEPGGFYAKARKSAHGLLHLNSLVVSPEQAIAATLGSGTCEMYRDEHGTWHCKSCENGADTDTGSDGTLDAWCDAWPPNFCPNCGRKRVSANE